MGLVGDEDMGISVAIRDEDSGVSGVSRVKIMGLSWG